MRNGLYLSEVDVPLDINHCFCLASGSCTVSFIWILYICKQLDYWPIDHQLHAVRRPVHWKNINYIHRGYLLSCTKKKTLAEMPKGCLGSAKETHYKTHQQSIIWVLLIQNGWSEREVLYEKVSGGVFTKRESGLQAEEYWQDCWQSESYTHPLSHIISNNHIISQTLPGRFETLQALLKLTTQPAHCDPEHAAHPSVTAKHLIIAEKEKKKG